MKTTVLLFVLTLLWSTNVFAQSGRNAPKTAPQNTPTVAPPIETTPPPVREAAEKPIANAGGKPKFAADPNADKYKIVFSATSNTDPNLFAEKTDWQLDASRADLLEALNKAGAEGYRFVGATGKMPVVLLKADEAQYEYQVLETGGSGGLGTSANGFLERHDEMQRQGFKLVENHPLVNFTSCVEVGDGCVRCTGFSRVLYFYEKQLDARRAPKQTLVTVDAFQRRMSAELTSQINARSTDGFFPFKALSDFNILLEEAAGENEFAGETPEMQVVRGTIGRAEVIGKTNYLARQGFRVALANSRIVIMYRRNEKNEKNEKREPISYVWLRTKDADFQKDLVKLAEKGAFYRATYPSINGDEATLIFEVPKNADKPREYKVLNLDFDNAPDLRASRTPGQQLAAVKTLNELARQGFAAREIFVAGKTGAISVLLER